MRRLALVLLALALAEGAAAAVLGRDPAGPFPPAETLSTRGFAVWPVDTVAEAEEECASPEDWRLDAGATALRFARGVLGYPEPTAGDTPGDRHHYRLSINTGGIDELFLGSVIEVDRYGRCWYVTLGLPREGELGATLGFVYGNGRPQLLLSSAHGLPHGSVGFGDWSTEIDAGRRQTVTPLPDLDEDATGHALYTTPDDRGISEGMVALPLPPVPPAPREPPASWLHEAAAIEDPAICAIAPSSRRSPEAVLRNLFEWTFPALLEQRKGFPYYERRRSRHLGGDRWRVVVDGAVLDATIPRIARRCYALVSMEPVRGDAPLRAVRFEKESVTFDFDWDGGDEATFGFATAADGGSGALRRIPEQVTFQAAPGEGPLFARVVLYEEGHVVSAYFGLFR